MPSQTNGARKAGNAKRPLPACVGFHGSYPSLRLAEACCTNASRHAEPASRSDFQQDEFVTEGNRLPPQELLSLSGFLRFVASSVAVSCGQGHAHRRCFQ